MCLAQRFFTSCCNSRYEVHIILYLTGVPCSLPPFTFLLFNTLNHLLAFPSSKIFRCILNLFSWPQYWNKYFPRGSLVSLSEVQYLEKLPVSWFFSMPAPLGAYSYKWWMRICRCKCADMSSCIYSFVFSIYLLWTLFFERISKDLMEPAFLLKISFLLSWVSLLCNNSL